MVRLWGGKIDWDVSIHPSAQIDFPWHLTMKHKSSLGEHCWVYCMENIIIGESTCIGKEVYLITGSHNINSPGFELVTRPITIGSNVWIATGSTVMPGIELGDYAVVGASSVVTKHVESYDVVGGNPAKFLKKRIISNE